MMKTILTVMLLLLMVANIITLCLTIVEWHKWHTVRKRNKKYFEWSKQYEHRRINTLPTVR